MKTIKGPGIFIAQFLRDEEPFNNLGSISKWVADLGYKGVQIPTWDTRVIDLDRAAESKTYCDGKKPWDFKDDQKKAANLKNIIGKSKIL